MESNKLKIVITTDIHGTIYSTNFSDGRDEKMGLSRLSTYLKETRKSNRLVLIDNGDVNQGSALVTYTNKYEEDNIMSKAFNALAYDYINIGNHDFNYGSDFLMNYIKETNGKCITSNVLYDNKPIGYSQILNIEEEDLKIGLIGGVTDYIENWEKESNLENIEILSVFHTIKNEVDKLRKEVDYIIVCYHGGLERDPETGEKTESLTGENIGYKLLTEIEGIDVLITGHQHRSFVHRVNNTLVVQATNELTEFMELSYEDNEFTANIINSGNYEIDKDFLQDFKETYKDLQNWLDQPIGENSNKDLIVEDLIEAQMNKHPFVSLVNQAQLDITGADISVSSLYDTTSGFGKTITYRDLVSNFPFPNTIVVKNITGRLLKEYLEQNASYWIVRDGKIVVNPEFLEPKRQIFNYDMADGIEYTIKVSNPIGEKIMDLTINNKPVEEDKEYKIVMNNYRASGGGDFNMLIDLKTLYESADEMIGVMNKYIRENQLLDFKHQDNIKIII